MTATKRGFTEEEAAQYIGMSRSFLRQDRMNGFRKQRILGPNYVKIGKSVRYLTHLDAWLDSYRITRIHPNNYLN